MHRPLSDYNDNPDFEDDAPTAFIAALVVIVVIVLAGSALAEWVF